MERRTKRILSQVNPWKQSQLWPKYNSIIAAIFVMLSLKIAHSNVHPAYDLISSSIINFGQLYNRENGLKRKTLSNRLCGQFPVWKEKILDRWVVTNISPSAWTLNI